MFYLIRTSSRVFEDLDFLDYIDIHHTVRNEIHRFRTVEHMLNVPSSIESGAIKEREKGSWRGVSTNG